MKALEHSERVRIALLNKKTGVFIEKLKHIRLIVKKLITFTPTMRTCYAYLLRSR